MMFVSFARQYRRMLFSRIPKPRHLTTLYSPPTGTYIPCDMCEVYNHAWQWQLGKVNIDSDYIEDNATLFVGIEEVDVRVDKRLDIHESDGGFFGSQN